MGQVSPIGQTKITEFALNQTESPSIQKATFYGDDFENSPFYNQEVEPELYQVSIQAIAETEGKILSATNVAEFSPNTTHPSVRQKPTRGSTAELNKIHLMGLCLLISIDYIDEFIDENGLRPVVDELKERQWIITLALALYVAFM